ncbi:hypothetical protein ACFWUZ_03140 [Streptomyces sp. NPDC058646]|uniref:hypothetical protein n=1 Tax=Streptomyces sp. NPDC058646 TaxID=3346574 RepID=UPI0036651F96
MQREEFYTRFSDTLRTLRAPRELPVPGPADNLWDLGFLDSFAMVEVLIHLEELVGREIELTADSLRTFHTLERIYDTYVAEVAA